MSTDMIYLPIAVVLFLAILILFSVVKKNSKKTKDRITKIENLNSNSVFSESIKQKYDLDVLKVQYEKNKGKSKPIEKLKRDIDIDKSSPTYLEPFARKED